MVYQFMKVTESTLKSNGEENSIITARFTKILKPILEKLRGQGHQSVAYLDDWYLQGKSSKICALNISDTCVLLQKAGFHINIQKSKLIPSRKIEFLWLELDSAEMTITLPLNKRQTVVQACEAIAHTSARIPIRLWHAP